jgi:hypothetical protein
MSLFFNNDESKLQKGAFTGKIKKQTFRDWVYLLASFLFFFLGAVYNFDNFRKTRNGFAWKCLFAGLLGLVLTFILF